MTRAESPPTSPSRRTSRTGTFPHQEAHGYLPAHRPAHPTEADDLTDELIDRFGETPPGVNALIHVALLRGEAGAPGITDISQKQGDTALYPE